jgi:hypothetical protein
MESQAVAIGNLGPVDPDTGAEGLTALLLAARLSKEDEPKAIAPPSPEPSHPKPPASQRRSPTLPRTDFRNRRSPKWWRII